MRIVVNGNAREVPQGATVAWLVEDTGSGGEGGRGVAVAVNADVVPRSAWAVTELLEGQKIEIVAAIQGG